MINIKTGIFQALLVFIEEVEALKGFSLLEKRVSKEKIKNINNSVKVFVIENLKAKVVVIRKDMMKTIKSLKKENIYFRI